MSNQNKTEAQLQKELLDTVNEVGELLRKSGLAKAEDDEIGAVPPEHAEPDADQMGGPSDQDADNMPPPAAEGAPAPEGEMPPEGAPEGQEGGDEASEMASHAAELSDEELQSMLEVLMAEVEKRHAGAQGAAPEGAAPAPAPQGAPAPAAPEPMAASMKKEFASLSKSVAEIAEAVKSITGEVGTLKKSAAAQRQTTVTSKPSATTSRNVQVLQKSAEAKEKLNKSDTLQYLLSEQRGGNKKVNTDMIATVNACQSDSDLANAQRDIEKIGIKLP